MVLTLYDVLSSDQHLSPHLLNKKLSETGDQMGRTVNINKNMDLSAFLNVVGIIWDNVSTQLKNISNKGLVNFRPLNVEMLHIISLILAL